MKDISKRVCGMAVLLAACSGLTSYADEAVSEHPAGSAVSSFLLDGDSYRTSVSRLWEWNLDNRDGNQNQVSMAKCGDAIYLCVSYFEKTENRAGNLFLRKFSAETGELMENILIEVPEYFKAGLNFSSHTVVADDDGNLVVGLVKKDSGTGVVSMLLRKVDFSGDMVCIDEASGIDFDLRDIDISADDNEPWMERINGFSGSFDAGQFRFDTTIGRSVKSRYKYTHLDISVDNSLPASERVKTESFVFQFAGDHFQNSCPDVAGVPGDESHYVVTLNSALSGGNNNVTTGLVHPTLYMHGTAAGDNFNRFDWHSGDNGVCRGFYPFVHNGHVLAVYGASHNAAKGSAFRVVSMPSASTFDGVDDLCLLPAEPFPLGGSNQVAYERSYRQLAVAEPMGTQVRDNATSAVTSLYVCAPGGGIGAYELVTPMSPTGIDDASLPTEAVMHIEGRNLVTDAYGSFPEGVRVEVFDCSGRMVHSARLEASRHDLSMLQPGIYVVRAGGEVLKVSLR